MAMMLRLILLVAITTAVTSASPPRAHELDATYTFSQYLLHFNKSYLDPDEYSRRSQIFETNLKRILDHNEGRLDELGNVKKGYLMGINAFTDMENGEIKKGFNKLMHPAWRGQLNSHQRGELISPEMNGAVSRERFLEDPSYSYLLLPNFEVEPVSSLPASVDWSHVVNLAPDQGDCGSCWAHATTASIESHLAIATNSSDNLIRLSFKNILDCTPNPQECGGSGGCDGATVEVAFDYIANLTANNNGGMYRAEDLQSYGGYDGPCFSVNSDASPVVGIEGWSLLPGNNYTLTMNALAKVGPLAIAVAADGWQGYESGILYTSESTVDHAVLLVGYGTDESTGEDYYLVRNSWGSGWGESGYVRIRRSDDESSNCAMDQDPLQGIGCALNKDGNATDVQPVQVCGESAVLFDPVYPVGVHMLE